MFDDDSLGSFEQLVMLAILRLGDDAYGMTVRREIEDRIGRATSIGAVYSTLDRLDKKGYLRSSAGESNAARNGRAKKFYRLESTGLGALKRSLRAVEIMSKGLKELKGPIGGIA